MKVTSYGLDTSEPQLQRTRHPDVARPSRAASAPWFLPLVGAYYRLKDKLA